MKNLKLKIARASDLGNLIINLGSLFFGCFKARRLITATKFLSADLGNEDSKHLINSTT
jgi:hypothetical protein